MAKMTVTRSYNGNLDASFSAYLNLKPTDSTTTTTTTTTTIHGRAHQNVHIKDCEISIFDAQKYFNEGDNNNPSTPPPNHRAQIKLDTKRVPLTRVSLSDLPRISSASSVDTPSRSNNYRVGVGGRSFHATPTASSEASWNSQTGLLSNPPGSIKVSLRNVPTITTATTAAAAAAYAHQKKSSRSKWFFGRRCPCPCTGKRSLRVDENPVRPKIPVRSVIAEKPIMLKTVESVPVIAKHETVKAGGRALMHQDELATSPPVFPLDNKSGSRGSVAENDGAEFAAAESTHRIVATGRTFTDNSTVAGFSFPILSNNPVKLILNPMRVTPPISTNPNSDEPPRESLEVFRPYEDQETPSRNPSLDLRVHRERRSFTFPASPKSRMTTVTDDDVASDASSDLFEIESFSTQTTATTTCPVLYRRRDSMEEEEASTTSSIHLRRRLSAVTNGGMGGLYYPMTPTECYEPSEASIDWSVTTAEGFDRGSVTSYPNGLSDVGVLDDEEKMMGRKKGGGGWNALLSCRYKKAQQHDQLQPQPQSSSRPQYDHHQSQSNSKSSVNLNTSKPSFGRAAGSYF